MSRVTADIGEDLRAALDAYARRAGLTTSEAVRTVVVRGLGGSAAEAHSLNELYAQRRREIAEERLGAGEPVLSGVPGAVRRSAPTWIHARMPSSYPKRVRRKGGLRAVVERGLRIVGQE